MIECQSFTILQLSFRVEINITSLVLYESRQNTTSHKIFITKIRFVHQKRIDYRIILHKTSSKTEKWINRLFITSKFIILYHQMVIPSKKSPRKVFTGSTRYQNYSDNPCTTQSSKNPFKLHYYFVELFQSMNFVRFWWIGKHESFFIPFRLYNNHSCNHLHLKFQRLDPYRLILNVSSRFSTWYLLGSWHSGPIKSDNNNHKKSWLLFAGIKKHWTVFASSCGYLESKKS